MKYVLIIPDGCADEPQKSLGGRTPLEAAATPHMDAIARAGLLARANNVPPSLPAGSDTATLSLFGYDPLRYHTGRAPLEAAAMGIRLGPDDWAVRCNLVTVADETMRSFTAGHISSEEAALLIDHLRERLGDHHLEFYPGVSYRNLMVHRSDATAAQAPEHPSPLVGEGRRGGSNTPSPLAGEGRRGAPSPLPLVEPRTGGGRLHKTSPFDHTTATTPPHDIPEQPIADHLPRGAGSDLLRRLMATSRELLADHPVNRARVAAGKLPATQIWLWGQGRPPALAPFAEQYGPRGAIITAVDLLRGIAALIGWKRIDVPGATGYLDTDYAAKGRAAVAALQEFDFVCVHVEATDEASHEGRADAKIHALEQIDRHIVGPLREALTSLPADPLPPAPRRSTTGHRIMVSPDHPTPLRTRVHSHGFVPVAIAGTGIEPDDFTTYDEQAAGRSPLVFDPGWMLMRFFIAH